jgi:hypothetical protein
MFHIYFTYGSYVLFKLIKNKIVVFDEVYIFYFILILYFSFYDTEKLYFLHFWKKKYNEEPRNGKFLFLYRLWNIWLELFPINQHNTEQWHTCHQSLMNFFFQVSVLFSMLKSTSPFFDRPHNFMYLF